MASLLAARLVCRAPAVQYTLLRQLPKHSLIRSFANDGRDALSKAARRQTLRERAMAPASDTAFNLGRGALAGGSLLGIGALCYYGLGLSNDVGALEHSAIWPEYVRERIRTTYMYFGGSLAITAASAMAAFRSPIMMNMVSRGGFMGIALTLAAMMGTGMLCQSIEYSEGFGAKQAAWLLHAGTIGAVLAPLCLLGGPLLVKAAWYTAGVVGGLSTIAVCAPSEKFLNMGAPLAMGFGVVFAAAIGSAFLPPTTALGAGLYSVSIYGGLLLFSAFLLYDTQRIIKQAEEYPASAKVLGLRPYDPVNASIAIYLDTINIFIRIATILASGGGQRR